MIRSATADDFAAVGELTVAVYIGEGFIPASSPYAQTLADTATRAAAAEVLVAEHLGEVVGSITVARPGSDYAPLARPGELEFRMLAVAKAARGLGVGTALVEHVLTIAAAEGYDSVVISTQSNMVDARRVYDRLGFVYVPQRDWQPIPGVELTVLEFAITRLRFSPIGREAPPPTREQRRAAGQGLAQPGQAVVLPRFRRAQAWRVSSLRPQAIHDS